MANYKLEVRKQYGTFRARFYDAAGAADETEYSTLEEVIAGVKRTAAKLDFDADSIVFRGIAYSSPEAVAAQVKTAIY